MRSDIKSVSLFLLLLLLCIFLGLRMLCGSNEETAWKHEADRGTNKVDAPMPESASDIPKNFQDKVCASPHLSTGTGVL